MEYGLEGGEKGGKIVVMGTPEEIIDINTSYTAQYLKKYLTKN